MLKRALEIDRDLLIEQRIVAVGDFCEFHDAGIVDEHVDAAERGFRGVEHAAHRVGVADIGLGGERPAALAFDLAGQRLGGFGIAGIVDDDGEAVAGETLRHSGTDATGGACYDCYFVGFVGHFQSPHAFAASPRLDEEKLDPSIFRIIMHYLASQSAI